MDAAWRMRIPCVSNINHIGMAVRDLAETTGRYEAMGFCGLGGRVHAELAWAKLGALAEGARLASKKLWG
jgi:hypothetical protein